MWVSEKLGLATWQHDASRIDVDARGGGDGIRLSTTGLLSATVSLQPVDEASLPEAADQFIRGDQWHVSFPQTSGTFSLDLAFRPVLTDGDCLIMELTLSIHTSLLDTHPMIDLCVPGAQRRLWLTETELVAAPASGGSAAITCTDPRDGGVGSAAVLLGPSDRAFTSDRSTPNQLRLRLFGDFLEKGVIRKARPWIVLGSCSETRLVELCNELGATPLPLAT